MDGIGASHLDGIVLGGGSQNAVCDAGADKQHGEGDGGDGDAPMGLAVLGLACGSGRLGSSGRSFGFQGAPICSPRSVGVAASSLFS